MAAQTFSCNLEISLFAIFFLLGISPLRTDLLNACYQSTQISDITDVDNICYNLLK